MKDLTRRQEEVVLFIRSALEKRGAAPSLREIARHFNVRAVGTVQNHFRALAKKGALDFLQATRRGFQVKNLKPTVIIPELGQVRAGAPILADEAVEAYVSVDRDLARGGGKLFALRVKGDSMKDAGIFEGDRVVVRKQEWAQNGDLVVALKDDEATVKTFRKKGGMIFLEPANPAYETMPAAGFTIVGKVVGLTRTY